ncbi:TonB-dependent receptor [Caulobacter sp. DWR2-3-1b2]|uniref:TonB-dependent receptor n=1 Tax=Caulobacter sp. DWR2-3-1b2 TaxID=2804642 RepID=UPI003CED72B5
MYGFEVSQQWELGADRWRAGVDGRYDDIRQVGLFHARARQRLNLVRDDRVKEGSVGLFVANDHRFNDKLRSYVGLRYDHYNFDVGSEPLAANSGQAKDGKASIKASLVYKPVAPLELYASYGQGFPSNDARGVTITVDPVSGDPAQPVTPLVRSVGGEVGARVYLGDRLQATAAVWTLQLDSELLFVGDAGNTEVSRPSRRGGVELGLYYFPAKAVNANLEVSYSGARFRDSDPVGDKIPGSIPLVVSAGVSAKSGTGWLASAQVRYFSPYPLIEDESVKSTGSGLVNVRVGRDLKRVGLYVDVLNVLDSNDHDVDYYHASRLAGEPTEGVEDVHYHVFQPRSVRASLRYRF